MKKRLIALALLFTMLLPCVCSMAEENTQYLDSNIQFLKQFLDSREYHYSEENNGEFITVPFSMDGSYPQGYLYFTVYDDGIQCEFRANAVASGSALLELSRFAMHLNAQNRISSFFIDENGELWSRSFCFSNAGVIDENNLYACYSGVYYAFYNAGSQFYSIINDGATAQDMINAMNAQ